MTTKTGRILYGFGSRGVAVFPPDEKPDGIEPIPLFQTSEEVQAGIDAQNAKRGIGNLHIIEYEVREQ